MAQFFEDFESGTLGQAFPGFTTKISRSGDSVNIQQDFSFNNKKFLQLFKGGTGGSLAVAWDSLNGAQDVEQLVLFKMNGAIPTSGRYGILLNRYDGTTEATTRGFSATFTPASSQPSIIINEDSVGTVHFINYAWENNQLYWARFRVNGNDESFKIWKYGDDEPAAWTLAGTFASSVIANPYSGLGSFQAWSNMLVYQLSAGTNGDVAPKTNPAIPSSTPNGVLGGGFGSLGNGMAFRPAFTVEKLDYLANAFIDRQRALDYAANALIVHLKSTTYTSNAFIDRQNKVDSQSNAFIEWQKSTTHPANARIERIESVSYTSNAEIESYYFTADVKYQANARIEKSRSVEYSSNAFIEKRRTITHVANAFVEWQKKIDHTANAFIDRQNTLDYTANAFVEDKSSVEYTSNAFIEWQLTKPYTANAFIEWVKSRTYSTNARIERAGEQIDYVSNARIERIEQLSYTANANISNPIPDKLPQTWEDSETRQPQEWTADDKTPATWNESDEKQPAEWQDSQNKQPQQWSDSNSKKPSDWSPIYYD